MKPTLEVEVLYFHTLRDITRKTREKVRIEQGQRLSDLLRELRERYPELKNHDRSLMTAVNKEFAPRSRILKNGDEVALLPPVSGG